MRYIGIDLHTNSFTVCILERGESKTIRTFPLQHGGLEQCTQTLQSTDEVAIEATGNSTFFLSVFKVFYKTVFKMTKARCNLFVMTKVFWSLVQSNLVDNSSVKYSHFSFSYSHFTNVITMYSKLQRSNKI